MNRKQVQKHLKSLGYYHGNIDGVYGPKTKRAVKRFQRKFGLIVDGIAGPQTISALKFYFSNPKNTKPEPNKSAMSDLKPLSGSHFTASGFNKKIDIPFTKRRINEIINHCAATPEGKHFDIDDITVWHKKRGWSGPGYHFLILLDGTIQFGRPIGQIGAHTRGRNRNTVSIAYIGGVTADGKKAKDTRTPEQKAAMFYLNQELAEMYGIKIISGHNKYAAKACPSFAVNDDIIGNVRGFVKGRRVA